ncbi:MAG: hypothetical protein IPO35_17440 [Uliginosibacterium sp.]|nr:hypothetical protein [Uliginosibacterium sp.]
MQHASKEAEPTGELFLIFQEAVLPVYAKGHLSNERQHFEEARDWLGQIEEPLHSSPNFQISLRDWRKKSASLTQGNALSCSVVASISQALKPAAAWAAGQNLRIHFEWVWDGRTVFIVQADEAAPVEGFDPRKQLKCYRKHSSERPKLKCLQEISSSHAKRFSKINNVAIYKSLELPSCPIFVLDDESVFKRLLEGAQLI